MFTTAHPKSRPKGNLRHGRFCMGQKRGLGEVVCITKGGTKGGPVLCAWNLASGDNGSNIGQGHHFERSSRRDQHDSVEPVRPWYVVVSEWG